MLANLHGRSAHLLRHSLQSGSKIWRRSWASTAADKDGDGDSLTIGDVTVRLSRPKDPQLVPQQYVKYAPDGTLQLTQSALHHLRWMLQKDALRQDMFLLGQPGPRRRQLAMQFLELTQREVEYVALSRDTTESDLKQRREIHNKAAVYHDQGAVRAALNGRVLVLDGVEHAERNVLPILNNLLENREMHLESGKFLMSPERYDKLLEKHSRQQLDDWGLLRVSEQFRVVALGLPTHKYKGTPLDPPLRSRFQSRNVTAYTYGEMYEELQLEAPGVPGEQLKPLLTFALTLQQADPSLQLPDFPLHNLLLGVKMLETNPALSLHDVICRIYPYQAMLKTDQRKRVEELLKKLDIPLIPSHSINKIVSKSDENSRILLQLDDGLELKLPGGGQTPTATNFVDLPHQRQALASLLQAYAVGDVCLLGEKGVGKLTLTKELIRLLRQSAEPMMLYEDMTSRDLVQQRITSPAGDTVWRDSPLVRAAKSGSVAVLNGLHRLHKSTASVLQRLIHDRELQLCDGTTLLGAQRYQALIQQGLSEKELTERGFLPMHESFRIVALAEPPRPCGGGSQPNWLTPELLSLFLYQELRPLRQSEEQALLTELCGGNGELPAGLEPLLKLAQLLRSSQDPLLQGMSGTLSTRQLLKLGRRLAAYPQLSESSDVHEMLQNTFLARFMPALSRSALEEAIHQVGIKVDNQARRKSSRQTQETQIAVEDNNLRIGATRWPLGNPTEAQLSKVPSTLFYEMPQHVQLLERLLQDYLIGEHLLLVGNQGVGKNKLVDRLLELMQRPREYIQLHRDTTVHSLTLQATLKDGQVSYEDSALVQAVRSGHVLVVDEADKAPVNVTCILRTLVESGEMVLADGRRIVPPGAGGRVPNSIETHPDFRLIVLANRPGFPFLGNDFFAALGDVFSCHAISNPDPDSEIFLLQQYGPNVPKKTLRTLVNAFGELRTLADEGLLNYPYSTREVVSIVKHLERYPEENMSEVVGNVLDFDRYQPEALQQVNQVLAKHGIESYAEEEMIQAMRRQKTLQASVKRHSGLGVSGPKFGKLDPKNEPHVGGNTWAGGSGGRDTAGLGGKGGPFRLDKGHKVHQLSDEEKADVPEEIKKAAREMNRKAFEEKLKEIKMSAHDHKLYAQFSEPNRKQVQQLKAILEAMQTKSKERQWQKYQTHGDLDDTRLVEGITGEKNIYRRRAEANPWADHVQEKPNRLKLVVDVSGSMYRFNGYDGRLDRQLEAVVMVMEAFDGFEKKIVYDIVGHSGEGWEIPFVTAGSPPKNDKERFEAIRMMHAHSQFCWSGDSTVKAAREACSTLSAEQDYDNAIAVVLSDANLSRYGIAPKDLAIALKRGEPKVKGYAIFIGSLAEEAEEINAAMPAGQSFVCMDLTKLPHILQQIFTSSLL
ncbi:hypothetical protein KR200_008568 [Drosophila serrata]|nr:hypothetical protein KR200_008568 [Drosophila serrata]